MPVDAFRVQNFMGFIDSGWIEIRPLTLLFGRNSSGKSAILRALLLLQQSFNSPPSFGPLLFVGEEGLDFGGYREMVYNHDTMREIIVAFRHRFTLSDEAWFQEMPLTPDEDSYFLPEHEKSDGFSENRLVRALTELIDLRLNVDETNVVTLETELSFCHSPHHAGQAILKSLIIRDEIDEEIVGLTFKVDEKRWWISSDILSLDDLASTEWQSIEVSIQTGFFPKISLAEERFDPIDLQFRESQLSSSYSSYISLLGILYPDVRDFLNINYLGPLRPEPRRFYYTAAYTGNTPAKGGRRFVRYYLDAQNETGNNPAKKAQLEHIDRWLKESQLGAALRISPLDERRSLYEVQIIDAKDNQFSTNLREVGSGVAQVLPVILQAMLAPAGSLVIIEQPELHLHPSAQAELGDLFISAAKQGVRFLIETHSEHLLYRLQRRIAETTLADRRRKHEENDAFDPQLCIKADEVSIYFISRTKGESSKTAIIFDEWGRYVEQPDAFQTFFSHDLDELLALDDARLAMQEETE